MRLETELKRAGLQDKQAAVYIRLLELGPSTVQEISRKAKVARPTTYAILDYLITQGLITKLKRGKRSLFTPEPPDQLKRLLDHEQQVIIERQQDLERLLPQLRALFRNRNQELSAHYYPGVNGLKHMRQEMTRQCSSKDIWYNLAPSDHIKRVFGEDDMHGRARVAKNIWSKTIFTTSSEATKQRLLGSCQEHYTERRFLAPDHYATSAGITIFQDKIAIGSFTENPGGLIIDSKAATGTLKQFFDTLWKKLG